MSENLVLIDPAPLRHRARDGWVLRRAEGASMGTRWQVQLWTCPGLPDPEPLVQRACAETIALFSLWQPDSAICRYNHAAPGWHPVPAPLAALLREVMALSAQCAGALDPALGRLADLWGFGPSGPADQPPTAAEIAVARSRSGLTHLRFDGEGRLWQPGGLWLDFGGIAKGWAVDRASDLLTRAGLAVHMVEIGGEVKAQGLTPDARPWWIGLEAAPGLPGPRCLAALHGGAVAGSGDWQRRCGTAALSWSHSLDPVLGTPVRGPVRGVHVFLPRAALADAWASALMVLPPDQGLALADRAGIPALLTVSAAGQMRRCASRGLADWGWPEEETSACPMR
ncbi:FAD:protein FMN transferase [Phaeovulum sp. W22_SRMD_FR3]|uniref:FAD:protein FMN transferase n=1 Tax=Phaeovulum sp. W22_SRMD_FR3 TaxID=3240274 RepID=UPI003F948C28